jgi:hypothetical protein
MATKRTLIVPHKGDKRYIRRAADGEFMKKQVDVEKSLAADRRSHSQTIAPEGQGDRGDQKNSKSCAGFREAICQHLSGRVTSRSGLSRSRCASFALPAASACHYGNFTEPIAVLLKVPRNLTRR